MFKTIRQAHKLDIRFETPQSKSSAHAAQGKRVLVVGIALIAMILSVPADAQTGLPIINMIDDGSGETKYSLTLQLLALMTLLTLLPSLLLMNVVPPIVCAVDPSLPKVISPIVV